MTAPVLTYPDPNKEYLLETDAPKLGLGAVLSQKQSDGRYHPVAFGSQALRGAEHKYHSFLPKNWEYTISRPTCWAGNLKSGWIIIP